MDRLINVSIERPIAVIAAVLMVIMFGFVALETIPIQLTPDVNRPVITVTTQWPGAAPAEVEREVVNRQEKELKGIEGLESSQPLRNWAGPCNARVFCYQDDSNSASCIQ